MPRSSPGLSAASKRTWTSALSLGFSVAFTDPLKLFLGEETVRRDPGVLLLDSELYPVDFRRHRNVPVAVAMLRVLDELSEHKLVVVLLLLLERPIVYPRNDLLNVLPGCFG